MNGNRSNLGLQPPAPQVVHDAENGYGGFGSLIFNADPVRPIAAGDLAAQGLLPGPLRSESRTPSRIRNTTAAACATGSMKRDAILNFSWVHTFNPKLLLTLSPSITTTAPTTTPTRTTFPVATTDHHSSTYAGGQVSFSAQFAEEQCASRRLHVLPARQPVASRSMLTTAAPGSVPTRDSASGSLAAFFIDDKFKVTPWLTLIAGMRPTHFSGRHHGKRHQPALWRGAGSPSPALGLPRFLRTLLPGAAPAYGFGSAAAIRDQQQSRLLAVARRAGRRAPIRGDHSFPRLDDRCRQLQDHRPQLLRSQQRRRVQPVHSR